MIEVFEGRLGGGKSYSAVMRILAHLGSGGSVFSNIALNWPCCEEFVESRFGVHLEREQYSFIEEDQVPEFFKVVPLSPDSSVLVVIDEAHLFWNSRDWANASKHFLAWLTQSRKVGGDIIFITQSALNVDKQFIRLIQYVWRFRDMARVVVPGMGIRLPFVGNRILQCKFDYDGKTLQTRYFARKDQAVFKCYESSALLRPIPGYDAMLQGPRAQRRKLQKKKKKMSGKTYLYLLLGLFAMIGVSAWRLRSQKAPEPVVVRKSSVSSAVAVPARVQSDYDIVTEKFRGWDGDRLRTDGGEYCVGRMCSKGYVQAVVDNTAKIVSPQRRIIYVVCEAGGPVLGTERSPLAAAPAAAVSAPAASSAVESSSPRVEAQKHLKQPSWMDHLDVAHR